jgi:hypothetical protein
VRRRVRLGRGRASPSVLRIQTLCPTPARVRLGRCPTRPGL